MAASLFFFFFVCCFGVLASQSCLVLGQVGDSPLRPGYHYTRPRGWINDPVPYFDSNTQIYHLFTLCNPTNSTIPPWSPGGAQGYCHAISTDMTTNWEEMPLALNDSMGTGSVLPVGASASPLLGDATSVIFTSGAGLAFSSDPLLSEWKYFSQHAPVVPMPPPSVNVSLIGDVYVISNDNGSYSMFVGSSSGDGFQTGSPLLLQYESTNLVNWTFVNVFFAPDASLGPRMECPNFFMLNGETPLVIASAPNQGYSYFSLGQLEEGHFVSSHIGILDYGTVYSMESFTDDIGRQILYGWQKDLRSADEQAESGYAGSQTLPRQITIGPDGNVWTPPVQEVSLLQGEMYQFDNVAFSNGTYSVNVLTGNQYRLHIEASVAGLGDLPSFGFNLLMSDDGSERTSVYISPGSNLSCLDSPFTAGMDLPGNDIEGIPVSGSEATPEYCRELCCQTEGCVAFTFVQSQPGIGVPYCWRKKAVGSFNPLSDATSGIVASYTKMTLDTTLSSTDPNVGKGVYSATISGETSPFSSARMKGLVEDNGQCGTYVPALDMPGGDYSWFVTGNTSDECVAACCNDINCQLWAYANPQPAANPPCNEGVPCCYLKTYQNQVPTPNAVVTSGNVTRWSFNWMADIFVDHSVIEVYANNGQSVISSSVYPTLNTSVNIEVFASNAMTQFTLDAYEMRSFNSSSLAVKN